MTGRDPREDRCGSHAERRPGVLVIEDEPSIRRGLCDVLAFHGYEPEGVERGDEGLARALESDCALVLLDIMLPGIDGFEVCEKLRAAKPRLPILMLTARGSEEDVLRGFRCGSDDYVTKPFSVSELIARSEALLRRAGATSPAGGDGDSSTRPFVFAGWHVEPSELRATSSAGAIALTRRDIEVLALFAEEAGRIVSRRRLLKDVWDYPDPDRVETRSVDMHIAKLRKKLSLDGAGPIETIRGAGYRYSG